MAHLRRTKDRPFGFQPRGWSVLAIAVAAAGLLLALAGCDVAPLGPTPAPHSTMQATPVTGRTPLGTIQLRLYKLGSPMILQVMHSQSPTAAGGCPAGSMNVSLPPGAAPMPCFRPAGTPVTITSAGISQVTTSRQAPASGQQAQPASYGFMIGVPSPQAAAVTALIAQAYNSRGALGITVNGTLWEAPQVLQPFSGQQLQISLLSMSQAVQLHTLLTGLG